MFTAKRRNRRIPHFTMNVALVTFYDIFLYFIANSQNSTEDAYGGEQADKKMWLARTTEKRAIHRRRKTWDNTVVGCLKNREKTWNEGTKMAKNKKEWTKLICN